MPNTENSPNSSPTMGSEISAQPKVSPLPGAQIMTLKAADNSGKSRSLRIYRAIRYAVDNGARVINVSLGKQGLSKLEEISLKGKSGPFASPQNSLMARPRR